MSTEDVSSPPAAPNLYADISASDLVAQMATRMETTGDDWVAPFLLDALLAKGPEAVAPLSESLSEERRRKRRAQNDEHDPLAYYLAGPLCTLGAFEAAPRVIALLYDGDDDLNDTLTEVLPGLGAEAFPHLLPVIRDETVEWGVRAVAAEVAMKVSEHDAEKRAVLKNVLRDVITYHLERAKKANSGRHIGEVPGRLSDFEKLMLKGRPAGDRSDRGMLIASLINYLAEMQDETLRPFIESVFRANIVDLLFVGPDDMDDAFATGPDEPPYDRNEWLEHYKKRFAENEAQIFKDLQEAASDAPRSDFLVPLFIKRSRHPRTPQLTTWAATIPAGAGAERSTKNAISTRTIKRRRSAGRDFRSRRPLRHD